MLNAINNELKKINEVFIEILSVFVIIIFNKKQNFFFYL